MLNYTKLRRQLIKHEGFMRTPYKDSVGKMTIGVGRNLDDKGISKDEIALMLDNDIKIAERDARSLVPAFPHLNEVRQRVLVDMAFNMGRARLAGFKKMLAAIDVWDFAEARIQMMDSKWAVQVGRRAGRLAGMMVTGEDYDG